MSYRNAANAKPKEGEPYLSHRPRAVLVLLRVPGLDRSSNASPICYPHDIVLFDRKHARGDRRGVERVRGARAARSAAQRSSHRRDATILFRRAILDTKLADEARTSRPPRATTRRCSTAPNGAATRADESVVEQPRRDVHDARPARGRDRHVQGGDAPRRRRVDDRTASRSRSIATSAAAEREVIQSPRQGDSDVHAVPAERDEGRDVLRPEGRGVLLLRARRRGVRSGRGSRSSTGSATSSRARIPSSSRARRRTSPRSPRRASGARCRKRHGATLLERVARARTARGAHRRSRRASAIRPTPIPTTTISTRDLWESALHPDVGPYQRARRATRSGCSSDGTEDSVEARGRQAHRRDSPRAERARRVRAARPQLPVAQAVGAVRRRSRGRRRALAARRHAAGLDARARLRLDLAMCQAHAGRYADAEATLLRAQSTQHLDGRGRAAPRRGPHRARQARRGDRRARGRVRERARQHRRDAALAARRGVRPRAPPGRGAGPGRGRAALRSQPDDHRVAAVSVARRQASASTCSASRTRCRPPTTRTSRGPSTRCCTSAGSCSSHRRARGIAAPRSTFSELSALALPPTIRRDGGSATLDLDAAAAVVRKQMPAMRACLAKLPA